MISHNVISHLSINKGQNLIARQIQDVQIKCVPFYCNIAHELKGTGMKAKHILVDNIIKFLLPKFIDIQ
jgi:hypothetical protein